MQIHQLKRVHKLTKDQSVGRGGKRGKTSGRGGKGQTARAGNKRRPELRDLIKKLPKLRGRGLHLNKSFQPDFAPVNLDLIEIAFNNGETVTPETLVQKGVIKSFGGNAPAVKILSDGELTKKVTVEGCGISMSAKAKIEKAGGTVTMLARAMKVQKTRAAYVPKKIVVEAVKAPKAKPKVSAPKVAKTAEAKAEGKAKEAKAKAVK